MERKVGEIFTCGDKTYLNVKIVILMGTVFQHLVLSVYVLEVIDLIIPI